MKYTLLISILLSVPSIGQIPGTSLLTGTDDLSLTMLQGIGKFFDKETTTSVEGRMKYWQRDFSNFEAYNKSIEPNRKHLSRITGVVDNRDDSIKMEFIASNPSAMKIAEDKYFTAYSVRWNVLADIHGEGLLLQPKGDIKSKVVVIPDADQTPEMLIGILPGISPDLQYARHLAENGCQVIIPVIIDRSCTLSGNNRLNYHTNETHREWIYRQAYTFGRHIIGFEVQKILAAIDWFCQQGSDNSIPIGVAGWGEGGLLSLYSSAIDERIDVTLVSGYFSNRENLWQEPIYRNIFGLLREFGDAEIASMILPRSLIIEYSRYPEIFGPPTLKVKGLKGAGAAAKGKISTPPFDNVKSEIERTISLAPSYKDHIKFIHNNNNNAVDPVSNGSIVAFLQQLHPEATKIIDSKKEPADLRKHYDIDGRQYRQVAELEQHLQRLIIESRNIRDDFFWNKMASSTPELWGENVKAYQDILWDSIYGRIPEYPIDLNPRTLQIDDNPKWTIHEVVLNATKDIFVWGYLLLPKNLKPGEKRPLMVMQHGMGGVPFTVIDPNDKGYKAVGIQLVEQGYIVFAPHFPWKWGERFKDLQRKANPIGLTIISAILIQHDRMLDWLTTLPCVDSSRIGFYGKSWGGKIAVRIPALIDRYSLSICSADFNEWIWKLVSTDFKDSFMFYPDYDIFDFNLGMTFNYAEETALMAPRVAFMVERGHNDGVSIDEMVSFEYAKVKRLYDKLGFPDKCAIEIFNGGHEIHANGKNFEFIHQHFKIPPSNN